MCIICGSLLTSLPYCSYHYSAPCLDVPYNKQAWTFQLFDYHRWIIYKVNIVTTIPIKVCEQSVQHKEPGARNHQSNQATSPLTAFWFDIWPWQSFHLKFGKFGKSSMLIFLFIDSPHHCGNVLDSESCLVLCSLVLTIENREKNVAQSQQLPLDYLESFCK